MEAVLATKLSDRPVLGADGERLGEIYNVTMNTATGDLVAVVVDPVEDLDEFETTDEGRLRFPASCIQGLDDYLIVDTADERVTGEAI